MQIISKEGGLLLEDIFEGATRAYELGSQSMFCPLIVEDLDPPRRMLVEVARMLYKFVKFFGPNVYLYHPYNIFLLGYSHRCFARNEVFFWK